MKPSKALLLTLVLLTALEAGAQIYPWNLKPIFDQPLETSDVWGYELRQYVMERVPKLPSAASAAQWTREAEALRERLLSEVIFHGWPKKWVTAPPHFVAEGAIPGNGYRIEKLRYEIVPGFWSTALLYEPVHLAGKAPAVLSVLGHFEKGKAMDFNQKLCINYTLRGMIALTPEWIDMGELRQPDNDHINFEGDLDLVGANAVGLFYLAMRRPLDYLWNDPHVDRRRIGITGLSGGGWQTIMLSALDPRVDTAIPVAGFESILSGLDKISGPGRTPEGIGDMEQNPTDFYTVLDYPALVAMRAPRPTLEVYDATDDCCFRAPLVKPYVFREVQPIFQLFGQKSSLEWHENIQPGTHNYMLDNRQQSYRFFTQKFHLPIANREIPVASQVKSYDALAVGTPADNLTILSLAKKFAAEIQRSPIPQDPAAHDAWSASERTKLRGILRYEPVRMKHQWIIANTLGKGVESIAYHFEMSNNLSATGVWLKEPELRKSAPLVILLDDGGRRAVLAETSHGMPVISDLMAQGNQVLILDLLFTPVSSPNRHKAWAYAELLSAFGDRALGIEAAQLACVAQWARSEFGAPNLSAETYGIRNQVIALATSALFPKLFSQVKVHNGMRSLEYLLDAPVTYDRAPDLFCEDLYKEFDLNQLVALAAPTAVEQQYLKRATK